MKEGSQRIRTSALLVGALFSLGAVLRLILLDADPAYHAWYGAVVDEGRWTAAAREWALFGSSDLSVHFTRIHLVLAPAYQAVTALFFKILGVGFESARLVSSLSGIGLLAAALLFMRGRFSTEGLALMGLTLAIQPDLLFLSRLAIPETAAMLFEFLAFALLLSKPWSEARAFGAGLVTAIALALKATAAPIVIVLAASAVLIHRVEGKGWGVLRLGAYGLGVALPALLALAAALPIVGLGGDLQLVSTVASIAPELELNSAYRALATPFTARYAPAVYALLLPAWILAGVFVSAGGAPSHPARAIYWTSAMWALGWMIPSAALDYFPDRYTQHVFIPLAINIGAGLTLLQVVGAGKIATALGAASGLRKAIVAGWFALPAAVLLTPLLLTLARFGGLDEVRLRAQLPSVLFLTLLLAIAQSGRQRGTSATFTLITLPLVFAPLWFLGTHSGVIPGQFWDIEWSAAVWKLGLLAISSATTLLIHRDLERGGTLRRWGYAYPLLVTGLWLAQAGPRYLQPTYATVDASAAVDALVDESTLVGSEFATSVFLGNGLRYTERLHDPNSLPDVLVSAYRPLSGPLVGPYRLVASYEIAGMSCSDCEEGWAPSIRIYQRDP